MNKPFERAALIVSVPLFILVWESLSASGLVNGNLFPSPFHVLTTLQHQVLTRTLWLDLSASIVRISLGYVLGASLGVVIGVLTGQNKIIGNLLSPIFQLLRPIPPVAMVPIIILWFGLSETGKCVLILWGVFFAVWIAAHAGVQRADPILVRAARCLGASERNVLLHVVLPGALPTIFIGLRTAIGISFYTLVAAELAGAFAGIAYRIEISHQNMQTPEMMAGLITLGLLSAAADKGFTLISRHIIRWT